MHTYSVDNPYFRFPYVVDPNSCFVPGDPVMKHLILDLTVDFANRVIRGEAVIDFSQPGTIRLDFTGGAAEFFQLDRGARHSLDCIQLHDKAGSITGYELNVPETRRIGVEFVTAADAAGLHWMSGHETGSKQPMLISQNQPIGARSWIPCQDTPQVRFTWEATITIPAAGMHALMSDGANSCNRSNTYGSHTVDVFKYRQSKPVSAYLIWLAVGHFGSQSVNGVRLFAEIGKDLMRYMNELYASNTGRLLAVGRELFGEAVWNEHAEFGIFIPPTSFPYGGMENPGCVVIHPSSMDGCGSSGYIIAHELAHTWFGNMVTCATWQDLWLNEAWATWAELRLVEAVYGPDAAAALYHLNQYALEQTISTANQSPKQQLRLQIVSDLTDSHPDDALQTLAYHGGASVLYYIESRVGRQAFLRFARRYLKRFRFQALTTAQFVQFLQDEFGDVLQGTLVGDQELVSFLSNNPKYDLDKRHQPRFPITQDVQEVTSMKLPSHQQWSEWSAAHRLLYLHGLRDTLSQHAVRVLDLDHCHNDEVRGAQFEVWIRACANHGINIMNYYTNLQELGQYLSRIGRLKMAKLVFRALMCTPDGASLAARIFEAAAETMSPQWKRAIHQIVHPT